MALHHTQQRADDGEGIHPLPRQRRRPTPWHGAEASREDASIHRYGPAFALFDATSRCYRLGRIAKFRSSHQFKSTCARSLPFALMAQRAAGFPARYRPCPISPSVQSLLNAGNLGVFIAAHFSFGLSQNDPYHRVQSAPCHILKRLSCGSAKRQQTTTMEGRKMEYTPKGRIMSDVAFALRDFAGREWPALNHKGRMVQLARRLGLGHRRVRSIYQNEPGVALRADEAAAIAALRQEQRQTDDEYQALASRIARLEALYAREGEGVHSEHVAGLSAALNAGRGTNGAGGTGE